MKYFKLLEDEQVPLKEETLVEYELIHTGDDHFILKGNEIYKLFDVLPYETSDVELLKGIHGALIAALDRGQAYEIFKTIKYAEETTYHYGNLVPGKFTLNIVPELAVSLNDKQTESFKNSEQEFIKNNFKDLPKELKQAILSNMQLRGQLLLCSLEALFFYIRENDIDNFYDNMDKSEILSNYKRYVKEAASKLGFEMSKAYDASFPEELFTTDSKVALWKIIYKNTNINITATVDPKELRSEENIMGIKGFNFSLKTEKTDSNDFKGFELDKLTEKIKAII